MWTNQRPAVVLCCVIPRVVARSSNLGLRLFCYFVIPRVVAESRSLGLGLFFYFVIARVVAESRNPGLRAFYRHFWMLRLRAA